MSNITHIFIAGFISMMIGFLITPTLTNLMYRFKLWRSTRRDTNVKRGSFQEIYSDDEVRTPRLGGVIVWGGSTLTILFLSILSSIFGDTLSGLNFLSRSQTLLPLGAMLFGAGIGLFDDFVQIFGKGKWSTDPIIVRYIKATSICLLGLVLALWFYFKLGFTGVHVPWLGELTLGILFIPFFILVLFSVFSGAIIDGIDGLSGGVLASSFLALSTIAFFRGQYDLSAFGIIIVGTLLVFLWYNIIPARFYIGENGMVSLTALITVFAFFTDTVFLLPVIVFPLFITSLTTVLQMISKKLRNGKKILLVAPLHHHYEAKGWTKAKVVMRFWIVGLITSILGVILAFIS